MLSAYGWVAMRAHPPAERGWLETDPDFGDVERHDAARRQADDEMFDAFQRWLSSDHSSLMCQFLPNSNNDRGVLTFHVSRNHTAPELEALLDWICEHAPGSYGLVYVLDDEDDGSHRRTTGIDNSNRFRVLRILHGQVEEMDDPFFGDVYWSRYE